MLRLSENKPPDFPEIDQIKAYEKSKLPNWLRAFRMLLLVTLCIFLIFMFLPWTQNVRASGNLTTLDPGHRPQFIHATISGRIEQWYIREGQAVQKGDTIVRLSEVKTDYFDPKLVERMGNQVDAKEGAIASYNSKADALQNQIAAMEMELENKTAQIRNKIVQARLNITSDSVKIIQASIDLQVANRQLDGAQNLFNKGIKSLTDLEEKRLKVQETRAKLVAAENQLEASKRELSIYQTELSLVRNETANKIAKASSERFSTLSDRYDAEASVSKLQIERSNYARRSDFYFITAPQDGYIVKAARPGVGEIIKEGESIVSIQPAGYELAVEMYVKPLDVPLLSTGTKVRFLFDGWPAFFFSGWPGISTGTFGGRIVAIDRNISANGKFRVLVAPDPEEAEPWPTALLPGGGASGIALLNNVPLWYELWRLLNGFPPDLYKNNEMPENKK
ncbi:MAG: HlyD family secretion protein [Bacteroidota bacterium]